MKISKNKNGKLCQIIQGSILNTSFLCYYLIGDIMKQNEVKEEKYKLYKTVREILHPSISKKNISNYKIILKEELLPIKVYYPKKVSNINSAIIYVHGYSKINEEEGYSKLLSTMAKELDKMIISIDYNEDDLLDKQIESISKLYNHLYSGLKTNGIESENILIMGDSTGSTLIINIVNSGLIENIKEMKLLLFYPAIIDNNINHSPIDYEVITKLNKYYQKIINKKVITANDILKYGINEVYFPSTTIICGNVDSLLEPIKKIKEKSNNIDLKLISFASHNFLYSKDKEIKKEYIKIISSIL